MTRPLILRRIVIPAAITAFWLFMMGWLVRDYVMPLGALGVDAPGLTPEMLTTDWSNYHEWMSIRFGQNSSGVSYTAIERRPEQGGYLAGNRTWMDIELLGVRHAFRLETAALLDSKFQLLQAVARFRIDEVEMSFQALATAQRLLYGIAIDGQKRAGSKPLEQPISFYEAVRPLVGRRVTLEVGNVYRLPVLDSTWSMAEGVAEIHVAARETIQINGDAIQTYRLETKLGPAVSSTWVDSVGTVWKREFSGIVMTRIRGDQAAERFPGIDSPLVEPQIDVSDLKRSSEQAGDLESQVGPLSLLIKMLGRR